MGIPLADGGCCHRATAAECCNQIPVSLRSDPLGLIAAVPVQKARADDGEADCPDGDTPSHAGPLQVDEAHVGILVGVVDVRARELEVGFASLLSGKLAYILL